MYLVVSAELFPVGREGEQSAGGVHQTSYLQTVVVATSLAWTGALSSPHHVAVAALYAGRQKHTDIVNLMHFSG